MSTLAKSKETNKTKKQTNRKKTQVYKKKIQKLVRGT